MPHADLAARLPDECRGLCLECGDPVAAAEAVPAPTAPGFYLHADTCTDDRAPRARGLPRGQPCR